MTEYICQNCRSTIRYIPEYGQWWCDVCQTYVTGAYTAPGPANVADPGPVGVPEPTGPTADMQAQLAAAAYTDAALTAAAMADVQRQMRSNDFDWDDVDPDGVDDGLDEDDADDDPVFRGRPRRQLHGQQRRLMQRRARELRVRGFDRDEIVLILRDGYDEEKVIAMRGSSRRPQVPGGSSGPGPTGTPQQPTTIIVQGDYIGSKTESTVSVKDSVLNRASVGGGAGGEGAPGASSSSHAKYKRAVQRALRNDGKVDGTERGFLDDIRETEGIDEASAARLEREVAQEQSAGFRNIAGTCPQCKARAQPGWKACPECGARLAP
jgi:hypothetical protein